MLRAVATLACLLLLPASSLAMTLDVTAAPPVPLAPETENGRFELEATLDCAAVVARRMPLSEPMVELDWRAPPYALVSGPTSVAVPADACVIPQGQVTVPASFDVVVTRDAPGLSALPIEFRAYLTGQAMTGSPEEAQVETTVSTAPYILLQARSDAKLACACPEAVFELDLSNFGNVRTLVDFQLLETQPGLEVILPSPVILDSPTSGGLTNATAPIHVRLADTREAAFSIQIHSSAADSPEDKGTPLTVNFLARGPQTSDLASASLEESQLAPLPAAPLLGLVLVAMAWVARRRP